jgi:nitrile hydratase accessory protein
MRDSEFGLQGQLAPPLANGELVFEAPWQGRVFGMARSLCDSGLYSWDEFRERLINSIAQWESANPDALDSYEYYDLFLAAFENLLADKNLLHSDVLARVTAELNTRPHGHDHKH